MPGAEVAAALTLPVALALDALLGEPPNAVHPVAWMGKLAAVLVRVSPRRPRAAALLAGGLVTLAVAAAFTSASVLLMRSVEPIPWLTLVIGAPLLKSTFALRALGQAATQVKLALAAGDLHAARRRLGSLCSRDAACLEPPELIAATVESVAENASDSFVAPLLYYALFGLPGAVCYRAINTLDAMIGYRGELEYLGKVAARLDDLANLVPARLTAALLIAGGWAAGADARRGVRIWLRDGGRTPSPNAGRPMSAMAGLLGVELSKRGHYRLGDPLIRLGPGTIEQAWRTTTLAGILAAAWAITLVALRHVWSF